MNCHPVPHPRANVTDEDRAQRAIADLIEIYGGAKTQMDPASYVISIRPSDGFFCLSSVGGFRPRISR